MPGAGTVHVIVSVYNVPLTISRYEPVNSVIQDTPLAKVIFALNKFGWEVDPASDLEYHDETKGALAGKIKGGKILCRKTKITHYIDGKGKQN